MAGLGNLTYDNRENTGNYHCVYYGPDQQKSDKLKGSRSTLTKGKCEPASTTVRQLFEFQPDFLYNGIVPVFPVSEKKARALRDRFAALRCSEQDFEESFFKGNGVELRHRSSGIRIRCCQETSQALNRFLARRLLADELEARLQDKTRYQVKAERLREAKGKRRVPSLSDKLRQYTLRPIERKEESHPGTGGGKA